MISTLTDLSEGYPGKGFSAAPQCPICAGPSSVAHGAHNVHPVKPYRFQYRICQSCGHGWIDPMPSQGLLDYLYGSASSSVIGEGWTDIAEPRLTIPERLVTSRELAAGAVAQNYFELGVGKGVLYKQFVEAGWNCRGVEPGAWGRKLKGVAENINGVPTTPSANVLVALDVLEHIADPVATLGKLRTLATEGSRLYCAMPNRQSLRARVGRSRWRMLRPLGHIHFWSRKSVTYAFEKTGFTVEELVKTDLWEPRPIRTLRAAAAKMIEKLGLGDQWLAVARAASTNPTPHLPQR